MVYYLKLNRNIDYSIRNMQVWIDAISYDEDAIIYILCDNDSLNERIRKEINFRGVKYSFLKSIKREEDRKLMESIAVPRWYNAGYAHLTPFLHARKCGYSRFWNIDADDTMFALRARRIHEALLKAKEYATEYKIDLFSLDMWRSRSNSMHWSFGITFTNGEVDWISVMKKHSNYTSGSEYFTNWNHPKNIDEFFTYIKSKDRGLRIETFCFENLLFIHYSDDFILNPITSGVYRWRNGKLLFPIIQAIYGVESLGNVSIANDVVKLDISIDDNEGEFALACNAPFNSEMMNIVEAQEFKEQRLQEIQCQIRGKVIKFAETLNGNERIYIFGCGQFTSFLISVLRENEIEAISILDNATAKWGGSIEGLMVVSPEELKKENLDILRILIDVRFFNPIFSQLVNMGIEKKNIYEIVDYSLNG